MTAYAPTYASTDMSLITIDLLGTVLVGLVAFGSIIGLVMMARWLKGKKATAGF